MDAKIGTFEVAADTLIACDPLYLESPLERGIIHNCIPGRWEAHAILSDGKELNHYRVWKLAVFHESCPLERETTLEIIGQSKMPKGFVAAKKKIWVDTASCGFFDGSLAKTEKQAKGFYVRKGSLADRCMQIIPDSPPCSVVLPNGVVSASGFGDGSYLCCIHRDGEGNADAAFLRFR